MTKFTIEPVITTKRRIGNDFYGICLYHIESQHLQKRLAFRLKPLEITLEVASIECCWLGKFSIEFKFLKFKFVLGLWL